MLFAHLQTGKRMVVSLKELSFENGEPITDVKDGTMAIFAAKNGKT